MLNVLKEQTANGHIDNPIYPSNEMKRCVKILGKYAYRTCSGEMFSTLLFVMLQVTTSAVTVSLCNSRSHLFYSSVWTDILRHSTLVQWYILPGAFSTKLKCKHFVCEWNGKIIVWMISPVFIISHQYEILSFQACQCKIGQCSVSRIVWSHSW